MRKPQQHNNEREFSLSDKEFLFLTEIANRKTGIMLPANKRDMVYSRLVRRLRALKLESFAQYCELLNSNQGEAEMDNLVNSITTNLTHFFREAHHFEHLEKHVLAPNNAKKLRIWSAGCSSGMEAYSIAMSALAHLPNGADIRILATDIDTNMLDRGVKAEYAADEYVNIPTKYQKYVQKVGANMQMNAELQKIIAFKYLNLLETYPMKGKFDAIFCRNVVIYFDKTTQQQMFARMKKHLHPDGFLYIGHSENITTICPDFELIGKTIYRLKG